MNPAPRKRLLCISNGHGEDAIALRILNALQQHPNPPEISALPLVGEGGAYHRNHLSTVGPAQQMPSGGFVYMDGRQLVRDVRGGLLQLTVAQIRTVRQWASMGGAILAVGDIVPLLFAWISGAPYAFVGTAKSEYYIRDEQQGVLPRPSWFEQMESWSGSVYLPWERWLMGHRRCKAVFPRDTLTATVLRQWSIPIFDVGNPMMDGLEPQNRLPLQSLKSLNVSEHDDLEHYFSRHPLTLLLLPGSRPPEAYANWQILLQAVQSLKGSVKETRGDRPLVFLAAIAPGLDLAPLSDRLREQNWQMVSEPKNSEAMVFSQENSTLILSQSHFADSLHAADGAIAMAGTATEQFVGLGKPAFIIPGSGPQFTPAFAEAQTRLLGPSVIQLDHPQAAGKIIVDVLQDAQRLRQIRANGHRRMGEPGAGDRIATCIMKQLGWAA